MLPHSKNAKWLRKLGLESELYDIDLSEPTLPKSKICCGRKGFYSKKSETAVPYSEIAWVYLYVQRSYGLVVERSLIIRTKDRKKLSMTITEEETKSLIYQYILPNTTGVILGYGAEQKAEYKERYPK